MPPAGTGRRSSPSSSAGSGLEPGEEIAVVGTELRDIALLRIPQLFAHVEAVAFDQPAGYDDGDAAR